MSHLLEHPETLSKSEIGKMLFLLSEVRDYGYDETVFRHVGWELEYVETLEGKSKSQLYEERKKLYNYFVGLY